MFAIASFVCRYNLSVRQSFSSPFQATPFSAWATVGVPLLQGLSFLPVIVYCLLLSIMSLMLAIDDISARFPSAGALPPFAAVSRIVARNSNVSVARERVKLLLCPGAVCILPDTAPLKRRLSAACSHFWQLRLPRVPVTCVIMTCIALQLGLELLRYYAINFIGIFVEISYNLSDSGIILIERIAPPVILTLVSLPPFFLAYQTFSLTSRMRKTFMSALDDLLANAKPFRAGVRERCSMHSAALFLPMFSAYAAVSFIMLVLLLAFSVLIVLLAASLLVYCQLLENGSISIPEPSNYANLLQYSFLLFSQDYICPTYNNILNNVVQGFITSTVLAVVFAVLMYPDYFRICRTLVNNNRSACMGQLPEDHKGRLTVVRPGVAGSVGFSTICCVFRWKWRNVCSTQHTLLPLTLNAQDLLRLLLWL
jgi:hypothetical protein